MSTRDFPTPVRLPDNPDADYDGDRAEYHFDTLAGRKGDVFIFVDYIFQYNSGFSGATKTEMRPVSESELQQREENSDHRGPFIDSSYRAKYGETVEIWTDKLNIIPEDQIATVECIGGGRMTSAVDNSEIKILNDRVWRAAKVAEKESVYEIPQQ